MRNIASDARALVIGGLRVRGWTWLVSMLWVVIGAGGAIYAAVTFTHVGYGQGVIWMVQWPGEPQVIIDVAVIALPVWVLLSVPVLVAGFVRLRGGRPGNWLRVAGWAGSWVAGWALMNQTADWAAAGEGGTRGVLSVGELAICAAWLALGGAMTWIQQVPGWHVHQPEPPGPHPTAAATPSSQPNTLCDRACPGHRLRLK